MAKFRTRARALDMLGRQQIAGIPTAIGELFKNSHDAYASRVDVDYFPHKELFVLRDDGIGMTPEEFESRWLTLGTESKVDSEKGGLAEWIPPGKTKRAIMGEKGIGRLSIGIIGNQVLALTRAVREETHEMVMAFVNWGVFALPGIDLEDIEVPIQTFGKGRLPTANDIRELVSQFTASAKDLKTTEVAALKQILDEAEHFDIDPQEIENLAGGPRLFDGERGTAFYVMPASDSIGPDIERDLRADSAPEFLKYLLGFTTELLPNGRAPLFTNFRYWRGNSKQDLVDIFEECEFYTQADYDSCDHHIEGRLDEYGQFEGTISIYGKDPEHLIIPWPQSGGKHTLCGPYEFRLGYLMGTESESNLKGENYSYLANKLNKIGGVYVYRDGIRILPYGNVDYDFLHLEEKRAKSAKDHFYSYRRMIGFVSLKQEQNSALREKAGREGFQTNKAYNQFRSILENLFDRTAKDFFRKTGAQSNSFWEVKDEKKAAKEAADKLEKRKIERRNTFKEELKQFFEDLRRESFQKEIDKIRRTLINDIRSSSLVRDKTHSAKLLMEAEFHARKALQKIRKRKLVTPKGVFLGKLVDEHKEHLMEWENLETKLFMPFSDEIAERIESAAREAKAEVDRRRAFRMVFDGTKNDGIQTLKKQAGRTRISADEARERVVEIINKSQSEFISLTREIEAKFEKVPLSTMSSREIEQYKNQLEQSIFEGMETQRVRLENIANSLTELHWSEEGLDDFRLASEFQEDELRELKDEVGRDLDMAQLGLAAAILNHEFAQSVTLLRRNIRGLKRLADANEVLMPYYSPIETNFQHLDSFLKLFTPLEKRARRIRVKFTGNELVTFLKELFGNRFKRHKIELIASRKFRVFRFHGFRSNYYPVFMNLIDNAIYWLKEIHNRPREIRLEADGQIIIIRDNGNGLRPGDEKEVFERGFTRKRHGRGLGLYLTFLALKEEGKTIRARNDSGAAFYIEPNKKEEV